MLKKINIILMVLRFGFLITCIYALTPFSRNPNVIKYKNLYDNMKFLFITYIALYISIVNGCLTNYYRYFYKKKKNNQIDEYDQSEQMYRVTNFSIIFSFTFNILVSVVFWTLYFINKKLIVNKNSLIPGCETYLLTELSEHLFPLILSFLEQIDFKLRKTRAIKISIFFALLLWTVLVHIAKRYKKQFLYPFLEMNIYLRFIFFILVFLFNLISVKLIFFINKKTYNFNHKCL